MTPSAPTPLYDPVSDGAPPAGSRASGDTRPQPSQQCGAPEVVVAPSILPGAGGASASWVRRGSLAALLVATAALYLIGLGASGYANSFYSAAAQAGSTDWTAWFFGSLDGGNAITVDKPPAALWVMGLSVRLFGLNPWSILVPEALMGVLTAWLVYATVRRTLTHGTLTGALPQGPLFAHWAGLAGAALAALTPAATLMFRFNNPDALLVLLLTAATYATVRATENASRRWLLVAGVAIGFAFLTKMLQAFVILPPLVLAYAIAAPTTWRRKILNLLAAFVAVLASAGWYVAIFELTPVSQRPYMGGSQTNSFLELVFGYNGFGRITGTEVGSVGGGAQRGPNSGTGGLLRLFTGVSGGMVSWLIPAAFILAAVAIILLLGRRASRAAAADAPGVHRGADRVVLGAVVALAGSLAITGVVFSLMEGIYHDYYTVALAPFIGGTVALAAAVLWAHRDRVLASIGLAAASLATGVWSYLLARQAGGVYLTVGTAALAVGVLAGLGLLFADRLPRLVATGALAAAVLAALAGPTAYSLNTAATPHTGSIVTAGPVSGNGLGARGGFGGVGAQPAGRQRGPGTGAGVQPPAGFPGQAAQNGTQVQPGQAGAQGGAGVGGLLNGANVSAELVRLLLANADRYTWVAASVGSQNAASYQLATGHAVIAIGGFNGSDPSPTLAQFQALVASGRVHYYLGGGAFGGQNGGSDAASQIAAWVEAHFTAQPVGGATVYDVTQAG